MVSHPSTSSSSSPLPFPFRRLVVTDTGETESRILQAEDLPVLQSKFKDSADNLQNLSQNMYFLKGRQM